MTFSLHPKFRKSVVRKHLLESIARCRPPINGSRTQTPSEVVKIPIVKTVAGDRRRPFLYRTALWLRHRCVYDHPPLRHASSPPRTSQMRRSPRRPLAVDGRDAVVFNARSRVRVFHRRRSLARLRQDTSRAMCPSLGSIDTVDRLHTTSRGACRAARLASSSRDSRPERFRRKTRASWGHRGFFRASCVGIADPSPRPAFPPPSPTDRQTWPAKCLSARRTSR